MIAFSPSAVFPRFLGNLRTRHHALGQLASIDLAMITTPVKTMAWQCLAAPRNALNTCRKHSRLDYQWLKGV